MSSPYLFLNLFLINILNYTHIFQCITSIRPWFTLSKSSWQGCRRPKQQHSQRRPWREFLGKSGKFREVTCKQWNQILCRARLDLPCGNNLMPVGKDIRSTRILRLLLPYSIPQITFEIPFKGYFEAVIRAPISSGFSPPVSLHTTLDHILVDGQVLALFTLMLGWLKTTMFVCFRQHPGGRKTVCSVHSRAWGVKYQDT